MSKQSEVVIDLTGTAQAAASRTVQQQVGPAFWTRHSGRSGRCIRDPSFRTPYSEPFIMDLLFYLQSYIPKPFA
jgi:hypothetical protein